MFGSLVRVESRVNLELEALSNLVLDFDAGLKDVAGSPALGDSEAVLGVDVFSLQITVDDVRLGVGVTSDLKSDVGRGLGLDLEASAVDVEVFAQEVIGTFAQILRLKKVRKNGVV